MMPTTTVTLELDPPRLHVLIAALEVYGERMYSRADEARDTNGQMHTHLNHGIPAGGLDEAKLRELFALSETYLDELLGLIPDSEPITAVHEDGTPIDRTEVRGFPVSGSTALHLYRKLDELDDPALRMPTRNAEAGR